MVAINTPDDIPAEWTKLMMDILVGEQRLGEMKDPAERMRFTFATLLPLYERVQTVVMEYAMHGHAGDGGRKSLFAQTLANKVGLTLCSFQLAMWNMQASGQ